ncbi:rab GTPase-binding effector protein 1 [Zootermopsis nevadensis]|uniref:rab GTPase-binding effector protein 1 n=1 Tax=Zootermopsis nevadensis TaxID=136037 RepID=UPI000B8ECE92|nr:rab GTPase-binding effector protein 1 [Zootermopsis nevadensis]
METTSEIETFGAKSDGENGDLNSRVKGLLERIEKLENEKQQIREEFGHQRAKMKELYLQKEEELKRGAADQNCLLADVKRLSSELDEAKSQLVVAGFRMESDLQDEKRKCQEEIASLQQIVQETVEESSSSRSKYDSEVKRLKRANERLETQNLELRSLLQQQQQGTTDKGERETPILAPGVMLSAVTKTLARKVVSQLGADASSLSQDNMEDSMRKAQEDAEVLRSLVIPLEEEIRALKEKLRYTDQQLRKYEGDKDDAMKFSEEIGDLSVKEIVSVGAQNGPSVVSPSRDPGSTVIQSTSLDSKVHQSQAATGSPKVNVMNTSVTSISNLNELQVGSLKKQSPDGHSSIAEDSESVTDIVSKKDGESVGSPVSQGHLSAIARLPQAVTPCDMCSNYEAQLVRERTVERYREDLTKEADFRKDMEEKWNEKKEEHKVQVAELKKKMETAEETLQELRHTYTQVYSEVMDQLTSLTQQREQVQEQLSKLQKENDNLLGKHSAHSQQLQNEMINWPDKVEDLQELLLKFHEELIAAKVAKETMEEQEQTLHCEIQLIRDQMSGEHEERVSMEDNLTQELNSLKIHLHKCERERDKYKVTYEGLEKLVKSSQQTATEFETQLTDVLKVKKQLEEQVAELKSRVGSLQQELDNSEAVQKDFVRLSQSLQVQLERIREADTQVRWQHDEDIEECQGCRTGFFFPRSKQHCRHCGRIFCINCLSHTVHSGPNQRPSKVCDVCHTLLVRDTAPYFSTEPPHTPD